MIDFNKPLIWGNEKNFIDEVLTIGKLSGNGPFTQKCNEWFEHNLSCKKAFLTTSCTDALEMAALILNIKSGDEIIMPSYTFVSTASAFALRGAKIIFVDIRPDTMNIDEELIEAAVTEKTKAIVAVHYAGVGCEMDTILKIAQKYNLYVIEDAAQGLGSKYKDKYLGTIGDIGAFSFHETKNITCGEGGAIIINNPDLIEIAEIALEKGTNRKKFFRGEIDKYSWVNLGSSFLPSELNAAYLYAQLINLESVNQNRLNTCKRYFDGLFELKEAKIMDLPYIPKECKNNGHIFYIKTKDLDERTRLLDYLKKNDIMAVFHYVPLHSAPAGKKFGKFFGEDKWTTKESERLLRLPLYYGLEEKETLYIINKIKDFYEKD